MINFNDHSLRTLISSKNGLHLSAYLKHGYNVEETKDKLQNIIFETSNHLNTVLSQNELISFIQPIQSLLNDEKTLIKLKDNFAIFRKQDSFKILSIPSSFKEISVVADSFHVKPILKWIQNDKRYLLIGINLKHINIYKGSSNKPLILVETIKLENNEIYEFIENDLDLWFHDFLENHPQLKGFNIYVAGLNSLAKRVIENISYYPKYIQPIHHRFAKNALNSIAANISMIHKEERLSAHHNFLQEYYTAKSKNLTQNDVFKIAKSAVEGKVKKLLIREDIHVFGKICNSTGDLSVHFSELDHEDDDILDDIAQTVILNGGEVIIADKYQTPNDQSVIAIINDTKTKESNALPVIKNLSYGAFL